MELIVVAIVWYFFGPMFALGMFIGACALAAVGNNSNPPQYVYVPSKSHDTRDFDDLMEDLDEADIASIRIDSYR